MEKVHHSRRGVARGSRGFQRKMETKRRRGIYLPPTIADRQFPHASIKERCGLRQFRCRGKVKASMRSSLGLP